jgi:hypothetical protein
MNSFANRLRRRAGFRRQIESIVGFPAVCVGSAFKSFQPCRILQRVGGGSRLAQPLEVDSPHFALFRNGEDEFNRAVLAFDASHKHSAKHM